MSKPTPIDIETLPTGKANAILCWEANPAVASCYFCDAATSVKEVWATRGYVYTRKPTRNDYQRGSGMHWPLYATEAEAWDACVAEVEKFFRERIAKLRDIADAARKESPNDQP